MSDDYFYLCKVISEKVKSELVKRLSETGFVGETLSNPNNLKSTHKIDEVAIEIVLEVLQERKCNIYMESWRAQIDDQADFSIFIDPIDGSLNWERGIGDPCIVIAVSEKKGEVKLKDLTYAYVEGFRSGDRYYTREDSAYFFSHLTQKEVPIRCQGKTSLSEAMVYL